MTTRRDFLKTLGVGAAVAMVPLSLKAADIPVKLPPGAIFNKPEYPRTFLASAPATCENTTINIGMGHGARVRANDVILNIRTRETMLVAVRRRDQLTVVRGVGGFPYSVDTGDRFVVLSSEKGI